SSASWGAPSYRYPVTRVADADAVHQAHILLRVGGPHAHVELDPGDVVDAALRPRTIAAELSSADVVVAEERLELARRVSARALGHVDNNVAEDAAGLRRRRGRSIRRICRRACRRVGQRTPAGCPSV